MLLWRELASTTRVARDAHCPMRTILTRQRQWTTAFVCSMAAPSPEPATLTSQRTAMTGLATLFLASGAKTPPHATTTVERVSQVTATIQRHTLIAMATVCWQIAVRLLSRDAPMLVLATLTPSPILITRAVSLNLVQGVCIIMQRTTTPVRHEMTAAASLRGAQMLSLRRIRHKPM